MSELGGRRERPLSLELLNGPGTVWKNGRACVRRGLVQSEWFSMESGRDGGWPDVECNAGWFGRRGGAESGREDGGTWVRWWAKCGCGAAQLEGEWSRGWLDSGRGAGWRGRGGAAADDVGAG